MTGIVPGGLGKSYFLFDKIEKSYIQKTFHTIIGMISSYLSKVHFNKSDSHVCFYNTLIHVAGLYLPEYLPNKSKFK